MFLTIDSFGAADEVEHDSLELGQLGRKVWVTVPPHRSGAGAGQPVEDLEDERCAP
jgi:hypothetical protein